MIIRNLVWDESIKMVELLLQEFRVDPSIDNNYAIRLTVQNNRVKAVELLLQDPRVTK